MTKLKTFEIWMEGYRATGEHGVAQLIGIGKGNTFDEAVKDYMAKTARHGIEENTKTIYITEEAYENRDSNWNIWACSLYDNQNDAAKAFG